MSDETNQTERSPGDLLKYPRFDEREIVYRWRKDWFDGPINGSISSRNRRRDDERGILTYYLVYPLTEEEADFADSWSEEN